MKTSGKVLDSQRGAVSIFIVLFTALLITVITVGFVRTMVGDQQQATANDLSQSAYDSAMAGVEDAKRALSIANATQQALLNTGNCNTVGQILGGSASSAEMLIQKNAGDAKLDQAYTCVKVERDTVDYVKEPARRDRAEIVPLRSKQAFNSIELQWSHSKDLAEGEENFSLQSLSGSGPGNLLAQSDWPANRPAVLSSQLILPVTTVGETFRLSELDRAADSKARTVNLYPVSTGSGVTTLALAAEDTRSSNSQTVNSVRCVANPTTAGGAWGEYSCRTRISLPQSISAGATAYLKVIPRYSSTHLRVTLYNGSTAVNFDGVQPKVDSTGRANDIFRRVEARIEGDTAFPYPDAAVEVRGDLCKDFVVTDNSAHYSNSATCTP